jgi:hypothetical protein
VRLAFESWPYAPDSVEVAIAGLFTHAPGPDAGPVDPVMDPVRSLKLERDHGGPSSAPGLMRGVCIGAVRPYDEVVEENEAMGGGCG